MLRLESLCGNLQAAHAFPSFFNTSSGSRLTYMNRVRSRPLSFPRSGGLQFRRFSSGCEALVRTITLHFSAPAPLASPRSPISLFFSFLLSPLFVMLFPPLSFFLSFSLSLRLGPYLVRCLWPHSSRVSSLPCFSRPASRLQSYLPVQNRRVRPPRCGGESKGVASSFGCKRDLKIDMPCGTLGPRVRPRGRPDARLLLGQTLQVLPFLACDIR